MKQTRKPFAWEYLQKIVIVAANVVEVQISRDQIQKILQQVKAEISILILQSS